MITRRDDSDLSQLAKDIYAGLVFTSLSIRKDDVQTMLGCIFMPLMFGALADLSDEDKDDVGLIYEYMDKAGPLSINGYPMFFSYFCLGVADTRIVFEKVEKIKTLLASV